MSGLACVAFCAVATSARPPALHFEQSGSEQKARNGTAAIPIVIHYRLSHNEYDFDTRFQ